MGAAPLLQSYRVMKRIAIGGYGVVNQGVGPDGELVALKQELAREKVTRPVLEHEYRVYEALAGHKCIPNVKAYGLQQKFNVMVMDLLGPSLDDRFKDCSQSFSLRTTARLGLGMLEAIEYIHSCGFIHRDVEPENFLLGRGASSGVVHIIDFGLARRWRHSSVGQHSVGQQISFPKVDGVIGTLCFASIPAHLGQEQTRRDDLHSLAYTILLFARGSLPWEQIRGPTEKHRARRVLEKKRSWNPKRLCQHLPFELGEFVSHCLGLDENDEPDYSFLREKLSFLADQERWDVQAKFEWEEPEWKASDRSGPPAPRVQQINAPLVERGDVVLLRLIPEKSLDFEYPPRSSDPSFFPHETISRVVPRPPYRPAVVQKVITDPEDDFYFTLEVFPLMRRNGLDGLAKRRKRCFQPLPMLVSKISGLKAPSIDVFAYDYTLLGSFKVEYDQAAGISSLLCVPEPILARLESKLKKVQVDPRSEYDSDDEETRNMVRRIPKCWDGLAYVMEMQPYDPEGFAGKVADFSCLTGWNLEMIDVNTERIFEEGWGTESDDDLDLDLRFLDFPRSAERRFSCTLRMATSGQADECMPEADTLHSNTVKGLAGLDLNYED